MTGCSVLNTARTSRRSSRPSDAELGPAVIDRRLRDRAQNSLGNVGRAGNLQKVTAGCVVWFIWALR